MQIAFTTLVDEETAAAILAALAILDTGDPELAAPPDTSWARAGQLAAQGSAIGRGPVQWRTVERAGWRSRSSSGIPGLFEG
jgi:hypothetical protein